MQFVKIDPLENGAHDNYTISAETYLPPDGWCVVPDGAELPNFPFGTVEASEINGVMTLTKWTAGEIPPPPPPPEPTPSEEDDINAMLVDHELRIAMMELEVGGDA